MTNKTIILWCAVLLGGLSAVAQGREGWYDDYAAALKEAKAKQRPLLLLFHGSDWSKHSQNLEQQVLATPAFKQYAADKWVLVDVDFPRNKLVRDKAQNVGLKSKYGIRGYPTMVLLDASGEYVGRIIGYKAGSGAQAHIARLEAMRGRKGRPFKPAGGAAKKPGAVETPRKPVKKKSPPPFVKAPPRADDAAWAKIQARFRTEWAQPDGKRRERALLALGAANRTEAVQMLLAQMLATGDPHAPSFEETKKQLTAKRTAASRAMSDARKAGTTSPAYKEASARYQQIYRQLKAVDAAIWLGRNTRPAVVRALAGMWDPTVLEYLHAKGLSHRRWEVRTAVIQALGMAGHAASRSFVRSKIDDRDPRVATAAIDAAGKLRDVEALARLKVKLGHKQWQVRAAVVEALAQLHHPDGVKPLIDRLAKEKGRLADDIEKALERMTGVSMGSPRAWRTWWEANKTRLPGILARQRKKKEQKGTRKADGGSVAFYGIRTRSRRICFVVDISGSMSGKAKAARKSPTGGAQPAGERTKIEVMREELIKAIKGLPGRAIFNIVYFDTKVAIYSEQRMVAATPANKQSTIAWINKTLKPRGGTNIYDALDRAFKLAGAGVLSNYRHSVDTIFFMTDGAPGAGPVTDPQKIKEEFTQRNRMRRITIHCVAVGGSSTSWMKEFAEQNGGTFVAR